MGDEHSLGDQQASQMPFLCTILSRGPEQDDGYKGCTPPYLYVEILPYPLQYLRM
jgi:hypothetical protein